MLRHGQDLRAAAEAPLDKRWEFCYHIKGACIMDLKNVSTALLAEELSKREAVEKITAAPYEAYFITVGDRKISGSGPVVILKIWD